LKKWIVLLVVAVGVFAAYNRNRLFVRDPLGSVLRDGIKEQGAQVFINYANEALIENDNAPMYMTVIEHGDRIGTPAKINCIHYLVCLLDADQATLATAVRHGDVEAMDGREVRYRNGKAEVVVALR
jgi:hypothetical protein